MLLAVERRRFMNESKSECTSQLLSNVKKTFQTKKNHMNQIFGAGWNSLNSTSIQFARKEKGYENFSRIFFFMIS